ncbi:hypothetical protein RHO14_08195 [Orbus wheelerorum]|uniref:hypothetical protein n=1 Tax=Orbus wheelerorum TaxID=3074111 RepID=UPI00370D9C00
MDKNETDSPLHQINFIIFILLGFGFFCAAVTSFIRLELFGFVFLAIALFAFYFVYRSITSKTALKNNNEQKN